MKLTRNQFAQLAFVVVAVAAALLMISREIAAREREHTSWLEKIEKAKQTTSQDVLRSFVGWSEDVVRKDGAVEHWSGIDSEPLLIETMPSCERHYGSYDIPCWIVLARTKNSQRYYSLAIRVDMNHGWRLRADVKHEDLDLQNVVERAMKLGRNDVVTRLSVPKVDA